MDLSAILRRIDERQEALHLSDRALSIKATGRSDTIRNWRRAVEAGSGRGATLTTLTKVADALDVTAEWLIHGADTKPEGLAEGEVEPWRPPGGVTDAAPPAKWLSDAARRPEYYRIEQTAPAFAMVMGDVLVVDLNAAAADGDIVVVREVDPESGDHAHTKVMRKVGKFLLPGSVGPTIPQALDSNVVSIVGPVVGSFRKT